MNVVPRALIPVLLVTLSLLASFGATAQEPKPVKSVTGIILKAVPKAIAGNEKAATSRSRPRRTRRFSRS